MKHATDVRGSALIAGEVTMLRSQADVKFDTGDKEESGCLSANLAQRLPWVLVPSEASAEEGLDHARGPSRQLGSTGLRRKGLGDGGITEDAGNPEVMMVRWWRVVMGTEPPPPLLSMESSYFIVCNTRSCRLIP